VLDREDRVDDADRNSIGDSPEKGLDLNEGHVDEENHHPNIMDDTETRDDENGETQTAVQAMGLTERTSGINSRRSGSGCGNNSGTNLGSLLSKKNVDILNLTDRKITKLNSLKNYDSR
jgi:hypothetical protein